MARTPEQNREAIEWVIEYLQKSSSGKFINDTAIEQLAKVFGLAAGFKCGCPGTFQEGMRDQPFVTLLKVLLSSDAAAIALAPEIGEDGGLSFPGTEDFAVLAGETITNTGLTVITGDLGLSPGSSVTGFPPGVVVGTQHVTDVQAAAAQVALTAEYLYLAGLPGTVIADELGGTTVTPGTWTSAAPFAITSGAVTLDGQGDANAVFVFQSASTLTVGNGTAVVLAGGTQAKNVYWQVGSSATIGTTAVFQGNIVALTSISAATSAVIIGRLLARNGSVTLDTNEVDNV